MRKSYFSSRSRLALLPAIAVIFSACFSEVPDAVENPSQTSQEQQAKTPGLQARSEFSKGILERGKVITAAADVTKERYPDADDVLVDDYIFTRYNPDGTSAAWDDTFIKVLTEKGRRDHQTLSFYYTLPYSTVVLTVLEIIKPDGSVVSVDISENAREMINSTQMGSNIYDPNSKVLKVNVPGLEIGDMVRYVSFRDTVKTRVPDTWSDSFMLEYTSPIKRLSIEIAGPVSMPLKAVALKDEMPDTVKSFVKRGRDTNRYKWEVSDVPQMYREPNMPELHSVVQRLLVSTIENWEKVSEWYWRLCLPKLQAVTPEMVNKTRELTAGAATDTQKIQALFSFVSQNIRYMGITTEKEAPGYEPHDVSVTFENKYGVCRDKAALLVAMLRIAGQKAYPVMIMNGPKKDPDVPNPYFNHAIVAVEAADGSYILMDPTDENTREIFPAYLCNQSYLVAKPEGDTLRTSQIVPAAYNLLSVTTNASVNQSGTMISETSIQFDGINDGAYRDYFARRKPDERREFFERVLKNVLPGARLVDYDIQPKNIRDTSEPLKVYLRYVATDTMLHGDGKVMFPPPWMGSSLGVVNFIIGTAGLEKRKYPLVTEIACGVREVFSIDLKNAVGEQIILPDAESIDDPTLSWSQSFAFENNILSGNTEFMLKVVEFSPEQYLDLRASLKKMEHSRHKSPIFHQAGTQKIADDFIGRQGNAIVLDETIDCKIIDDSSWETTSSVKKKILSYAGKKQYSDLKFKYNPAWGSVSLKYAKVTGPDGKESTIKSDEINLMDEPWVGAAPRYPAGKILVVNLPGVEVGSTIEYRVVRNFRSRPFFAMTEYLRGFEPVKRKRVRVETPEDFALKISNKGAGAAFAFNDEEDGVYTWESNNVEAVKAESNLPPYWSFIPSLALSSADWDDYTKGLSVLFCKAAEGQEQAARIAGELSKDTEDDRGKITAVRDFVARNIRDAGPGLGELPISAITPADKTLAEGYGNTTDRAILLFSMLKSLGMSPEFVLVGDFPRLDQLRRYDDLPQPELFNKVLVKVMLGRSAIYLNDTDQYSELGSTPSENLVALPFNTALPGKVSVAPEFRRRTDTAYTIRLSEKGEAIISRKRVFHGTDFAAWNKKYAEMKSEERKRHFQEMMSRISQGAKPLNELKTDFSAYPGIEEFSVMVDNYAIAEKSYMYLNLPESLAGVIGLHPDNRENPMLLSSSREETWTYLLNLPESFAGKIPIAPASNVWNLPAKAGSVSIVNDRDFFNLSPKPVLFINMDVSLKPAFLKDLDFEDIQLVNERISNLRNQAVLMERSP
ncbi:MAG: DUF3857 domain-containing protein [Victivallales bacterium]|nr:DUF3857 domain-containing protein [Victivallales bacterium]